MAGRRFSVLRRVVALAPLLLLAVYVPGQMMLRCRMDGVVRATCCCPAADSDAHGSAPTAPAVTAQDCCQHEVSTGTRQPVEPPSMTAAGVAAPPPSGILAFTSAALSSCDQARANRAWRANGPPGHAGPAVILLKHAFLI